MEVLAGLAALVGLVILAFFCLFVLQVFVAPFLEFLLLAWPLLVGVVGGIILWTQEERALGNLLVLGGIAGEVLWARAASKEGSIIHRACSAIGDGLERAKHWNP